MRINRKHVHLKRNIIISLCIFALAAGTTALAMKQYVKADVSPSVSPVTGLAQKTLGSPQFSFAGAPGWRQGPVDKVSIAAFHDGDDSCFISIQQKPGSVSVAAALAKGQTDLTSSGYAVTPGDVVPLTLQTTTGPLSYELHEYAISGGGTQLLGGQALGYFALPNGYARVEGHCKTVDQLKAAIPALKALKFDPAE